MNLEYYQKLDLLISEGNTGGSELLAQKIGVCPRTLKQMVKDLKEKCGAPVEFSRKNETYYYKTKGRCFFSYRPGAKDMLISSLHSLMAETVIKMLPSCAIILLLFGDFQESFFYYFEFLFFSISFG